MSGAAALVGFMGAGKSTVAALVAARLEIPCVDTDELIARRHGPISGIFAERGEAAFREIERAVAVAALATAEEDPAIISLGGGAVTIEEVREALTRLAHVVWIDAPVEVLYARASTAGDRPLARDREAFERLYRERRPLYAAVASTKVATTAAETPREVAGRVLEVVS